MTIIENLISCALTSKIAELAIEPSSKMQFKNKLKHKGRKKRKFYLLL